MPGPRKARIGDVLTQHGQLTSQQVDQILIAQKTNGRPFGDLAQQMFGLTHKAIEAAWVDQYLDCETQVDLEAQHMDPVVLGLISRRQAWQLQLLPLCRQDHMLLVATTRKRLVRSVNFVWRRLREPVLVRVADPDQLETFLGKHYPWPAMKQPVTPLVATGIG